MHRADGPGFVTLVVEALEEIRQVERASSRAFASCVRTSGARSGGDAAYCAAPLSGMGTSLAIVGAYVLAGELAAAAGDHTTAFAAYHEEMRGFVETCQKLAQGNGKWFVPPTRGWIRMRNLNYKLLPYLPWRKVIEELPLKAGNAITLKEYAAARA
ncbi:hypothetical protein OG738_06530 [Amycolatopsis sp. NBC_01488]|uniref:hypothetical protein n=1 Tax=Amycolatopsis sp. NBC_01488 TaxID=2903563 RepID=UPI002E2C3748|nr:hypothetical protein [Amycolatopsis sp. NBC_01488]